MLVSLTEGNPFYISAVIRSNCPGKDLTTIDGLTRTLEFETLDDEGIIKSTWMEYISRSFPQINDRNAKNIVMHLSKYRERELTRKEILDNLAQLWDNLKHNFEFGFAESVTKLIKEHKSFSPASKIEE